MTLTKNRSRLDGPRITNGRPRPGGALAHFISRQDTRNEPIFEDGLVYVSVEDQHPRKAILNRSDFLRITARDPGGPRLTRTRWWLDEDGFIRAFSLHDQPMEHGTLVVAAILRAKDGDVLDVPADPFDLRPSQLKRA